MIPGLPSPPTDNLYKFIAVFGLVICGVSIAGVAYIHSAVVKVTQDDVKAYLDKIAALDLVKDKEKLNHLHFEFQQVAPQHTQYTFSLYGPVSIILGLLIGVGAVISGIGFRWWWYKVQQYQDKILYFEFLAAEREHKKQTPGID